MMRYYEGEIWGVERIIIATKHIGAVAVKLLDEIPKGAYYVDELLLKTNNHYGDYLTYYMRDFVVGENQHSEGLLHERMKSIATKC